MNQLETRIVTVYADAKENQLRFEEANPNRMIGYAAVFHSLSADLGGFRERIQPGSFRQSLTAGGDIRALVDHDPSKLLGRTSNNTLRATEDARGLRVEIDLPDTQYARDVRALVERGDVAGMSFGFKVRPGGQKFSKEGSQSIRELTSIDLREVTITSIPAYGDTSISLRVDPAVMEQIKEVECHPLRAQKMTLLRTTLAKG
jgi:HK97 family phage prohead protease